MNLGGLVRHCRACGCTDGAACVVGHDGAQVVGCHWVEDDLCSACELAEVLELEPLASPCDYCGAEMFDRARCDSCGAVLLGSR